MGVQLPNRQPAGPNETLRRVVIEGVTPEIDGGRFAVKRIAGDSVAVEADIFADGHDELACRLQSRHFDDEAWCETPMLALGNDRWCADFMAGEIGDYFYRIEAWVDHFRTWKRDLAKRIEAGQDVQVELLVGAALVRAAAKRAARGEARGLSAAAAALEAGTARTAFDEQLAERMDRFADRSVSTTYDRGQRIAVDRGRAGFSAWYELFPRSVSSKPGQHGTFRDVVQHLPYVADMGFDILYLPPVHPIGKINRKGKNNSPFGKPGDVGSPWAIGSADGGHKALNPALGTFDDFHALVESAQGRGMEVALDIAFQCAPDHPWVKEHPQWFVQRPDGSIRHAENPPKKYEDIYPVNFETPDSEGLWLELEKVIRFWMGHGVRVFRVDNPHTKAFPFWEWLLARIRSSDPDVIFLSEAFTTPKRMYHLAKLGFSQSYTYFTWRNTKQELTQYLTQLTVSPVNEFFRPNFWPNTPDILHEYLQEGGRPAFFARLVLAATLSSNYGIYGPAFELGVNRPREEGSEEYLDSEKYELPRWDLEAPHSLCAVIARVNSARRAHSALQRNDTLRFVEIDNDQLIAYAKSSLDGTDVVIMVVNLDPHNSQSGWLELPLADLELDASPFEVEDLLSDERHTWQGERNFILLDPKVTSAHIFSLKRPPKTLSTKRNKRL